MDGEGYFEDIALTTDGFYTILFPPISPVIVVKFDHNGRILNTKDFTLFGIYQLDQMVFMLRKQNGRYFCIK
jgi:hypothetical protein